MERASSHVLLAMFLQDNPFGLNGSDQWVTLLDLLDLFFRYLHLVSFRYFSRSLLMPETKRLEDDSGFPEVADDPPWPCLFGTLHQGSIGLPR
jgi:hypothetical protein